MNRSYYDCCCFEQYSRCWSNWIGSDDSLAGDDAIEDHSDDGYCRCYRLKDFECQKKTRRSSTSGDAVAIAAAAERRISIDR